LYQDFYSEIQSENFSQISDEEKREKIENFVNQTFYQKISKQKK
jgi:hypothetical protein